MSARKVHLMELRSSYGKPKRRAACTTTLQARMTDDVTKVTCGLCKTTNFYLDKAEGEDE